MAWKENNMIGSYMMSLSMVAGDMAAVTTHGVLPHTPINHTVFS